MPVLDTGIPRHLRATECHGDGHRTIGFFKIIYRFRSAPALRGDLDEAKAARAEGLKLEPEVNSLARWRDRFPRGNAQYMALFEKTVAAGLPRRGFPEE